jgi:hypothetical protein
MALLIGSRYYPIIKPRVYGDQIVGFLVMVLCTMHLATVTSKGL